MNEMPEDIIAAAENAYWDPECESTPMVIARAILAERERCAKVAERLAADRRAKEASYGYGPETATPAANSFWCEEIAAAIRQGQAKEGESA